MSNTTLPSAAESATLSAPRIAEQKGDRLFRWMVGIFGGVVILLAAAIAFELAASSKLVWSHFGLNFLTGREWDPIAEVFGVLPFAYGTLMSSIVALCISLPLGLGAAVFLTEMHSKRVADVLSFLLELLAAIPSVILGLMGIFILVPAMQKFSPYISKTLGFIPLFSGVSYGVGLLTAGLILAIMMIPFITSISRDVIRSVPQSLREAAYGLGATRWEVIRLVVLPYAKSGIMGAVFLALGRALGETMAVTMVIGNMPKISISLLDPSYTMAAVLANEFAEATTDIHIHALIGVALVLFAITIIVNGIARLMIYGKIGRKGKA